MWNLLFRNLSMKMTMAFPKRPYKKPSRDYRRRGLSRYTHNGKSDNQIFISSVTNGKREKNHRKRFLAVHSMYSPGHILCTVYCFKLLSNMDRRYTVCTVWKLSKMVLEPHQYRVYGILVGKREPLPDGTQYVRIYIYSHSRGKFKGDRGPPPPPPPPPQKAPGPGYLNGENVYLYQIRE